MADLLPGPRHVTSNTTVFLALLQPLDWRKVARLLGVAIQTALAEIGNLFFRRRESVWIVAGNASQFHRILARAIATAGNHLLHGTDKLEIIPASSSLDEIHLK